MKKIEFLAWCLLVGVGTLIILSSWPSSLGTLQASGLMPKSLEEPNGVPRRYILYIPRDYNSSHPIPLVVSLHGAADGGVDGRSQLKLGLGPEVWMRHRSDKPFPYFVLFPQARNSWSTDIADRRAVIQMLDITLKEYVIDTERIYLTGFSTGGEGVLRLAAEHSERWAAIVPVSCNSSCINIDQIKHLPIRWYQNRHNRIGEIRNKIAEIKKFGGSAKLIEYDDLSHDAWTRAYADPALYDWLNRRTRNQYTEL